MSSVAATEETSAVTTGNSSEEQKEIQAANVRSGLLNLELQAAQIIERLENLKTVPDEDQQQIQHLTPGFLNTERKRPSEILSTLESLIVNVCDANNSDDETCNIVLPPLDDVARLALISSSIVAYLSHLRRHHLSNVTSRIITDTNRWLSHVFRFIDCSASYHLDGTECVLRAVRLAIVSRCPGYLEGGIQSVINPCLYISEQSSVIGLRYACRQLGLPLDSIRLVPCSSAVGPTHGVMDISALQKMISSDIASNRTPLFVIADLGASIFGFVDNVSRLQDICKASGVWLHCRGHSLAALALMQGPGESTSIADSITLSLDGWLGIPNIPVVLLHRQIQNCALSIFESDPLKSRRLSSLSLWASLQTLGRDTISERLATAFELCRIMYEIASKIEGLRILSKAPATRDANIHMTVFDLMNKPLNPSLLFEVAVSVVAFQFDGYFLMEPELESNSDDQAVINKSIERNANSTYFDKLNWWLGTVLAKECPHVPLETVEHPVYGTFLRYCPFELGVGELVPTIENIEIFIESLESQMEILIATVKHKTTLKNVVEKIDCLRLVPLPNWAGLGGVRFVPDGWETLLTDQAKSELNKLNADLVEALKSSDTAFTLGEGPDGLTCVLFGMVAEETDIQELLGLVISVGKKVQENSKVMDSMTEIVKKGIETVTADLQRETEEKLWSEGILRHVPVVGNFVNWWSPPINDSGIKGRSLNLTQGVVESTENIYKYHMQMTGGISQLPGNKSPPAPLVQQTISSGADSGHSRTVSQSSVTSNNQLETTS